MLFDHDRDIAANIEEYRAMLGHVPQADVVYGSLTVRQNLLFAARLRAAGLAELNHAVESVDHVLAQVGLDEHSEKLAGILSGGQCKRLSVAVELLKRPRLLLLDEPTSGLDPASETSLMEQLRYLASQGTSVVCTTHLMDNLRLFDRLVVLGLVDGVGRVAYVGQPDGFQRQFDCRSFADVYDKLAEGKFSPLTNSAQDVPSSPSERAGSSTVSPRRGTSSVRSKLTSMVSKTIADNSWLQLLLLSWRAGLLIYRDRGLWITMLAQPLVLGLLVCLTQFAASEATMLNFFCIVVSIWLGLNNSARDLVRERRNYVRERLAGLRPESYLGSKAMVFLGAGIVQVLFLMFVIWLTSKRVLDESALKEMARMSPVWLFAVFWLSYACGLGLGLLVSALAQTEEAAVAVLPLLIMPQLLLSAMAVGQANDVYTRSDRTFKPLVLALQSGQDVVPFGRLVDCLSMLCYSRPATILAEVPGAKDFGGSVWPDFCHLLILLLGTWLLAYVAFLHAERKWPRLIGLG
jgi:ABC-type multidrug transport system ATPase subunit